MGQAPSKPAPKTNAGYATTGQFGASNTMNTQVPNGTYTATAQGNIVPTSGLQLGGARIGGL